MLRLALLVQSLWLTPSADPLVYEGVRRELELAELASLGDHLVSVLYLCTHAQVVSEALLHTAHFERYHPMLTGKKHVLVGNRGTGCSTGQRGRTSGTGCP